MIMASDPNEYRDKHENSHRYIHLEPNESLISHIVCLPYTIIKDLGRFLFLGDAGEHHISHSRTRDDKRPCYDDLFPGSRSLPLEQEVRRCPPS